MSSTYSQLPGTMNLAFKKAGDFSTLIDFDGVASLAGYTVTASVTSLVTGATVVPFSTTITDASAGQVQIALSDTQTAALAAGTYGWQLDWVAPGSVQRTALSGTVEVYA
jgi:methenyltetrahydromethanopterin cyclohydrolase